MENGPPRASFALAAQDAQRLAPVLKFITENAGADLRLPILAARAHLSPSRFHAVFRAATGVSPSAYLQGLRLKNAQALLLHGHGSVKEIAARVGFPDVFHFSRLFKKRCGMSPSDYRRSTRASF